MAFAENTAEGGSSTYADDGTATHHWAALDLCGAILKGYYPEGQEKPRTLTLNNREYTLDDERLERIKIYTDDVRRRAMGGHLFVEQFVDMPFLGDDEGGTADAIIALPSSRRGVICDLKDGSGEKVYAGYTDADGKPQPNPQLALYALGALPMLELFAPVEEFTLVINQPKLGHIDEFPITIAALKAFEQKARHAVELATAAMVAGESSLTTAGYLNPGEKQCRWCRAKARCPALAKFVSNEVKADFDEIQVEPIAPPVKHDELAKAYAAVPLIQQWCAAVEAELASRVAGGAQIEGPDGKPFKFVEGKQGARAWTDEKAAEALLVGQLGPKAYSEPKLLTAPAAAKVLDKKATKALWADVFEPLIKRPQGKPILALGSDPRPPFTGAASADDFNEPLCE